MGQFDNQEPLLQSCGPGGSSVASRGDAQGATSDDPTSTKALTSARH